MSKQLRLMLMSVFVLVGGSSLLTTEAEAAATGRCGTCYDTLESCSSGASSGACGGPANVFRCQAGHFCCSGGEYYGWCDTAEE